MLTGNDPGKPPNRRLREPGDFARTDRTSRNQPQSWWRPRGTENCLKGSQSADQSILLRPPEVIERLRVSRIQIGAIDYADGRMPHGIETGWVAEVVRKKKG